MKPAIATLLILTAFAFHANEAAAQEKTICPNPKKLRGMCMLLSSQDRDANPQGHFVYLYQRKFLEAACVDVNKDNDEVIARKISKVWKENESTLICNNTKFDVSNGNIIKFAVNIKFDNFITDVTYWKVNLNKVDETDGRTVLDYIRDQIERNKGLASEPVLKGYHSQLRKAGARYKSEL